MGGIFIKLGNLADLKIDPIQASSAKKMGWSFTSSGVRTALVEGEVDGGVAAPSSASSAMYASTSKAFPSEEVAAGYAPLVVCVN